MFFLFFFFGLSLDIESLKYMYTMVFAVEEINRDGSLLPGVRLGYRIRNSCFRYPWALDGALSLVTGDSNSCTMAASTTRSAGGNTGAVEGKSWLKTTEWNEINEGDVKDFFMQLAGEKVVPLLIGADSSTISIMLSSILQSLSVPIVSISCLKRK